MSRDQPVKAVKRQNAIQALGVRNLFLILSSVSFGVAGQLILKSGANKLGPIELTLSGLSALGSGIAQEPLVLFGYPFFIAGSLLWLVVLSRLDLSHAYPFLGIHYLLVTLSAWLILGEEVGLGRWLAVSLIVLGILVVGQSEVYNKDKHPAIEDIPPSSQHAP